MATDATLVETRDTPSHDTLVPDPQVQKEFGVTAGPTAAKVNFARSSKGDPAAEFSGPNPNRRQIDMAVAIPA